MCPRKKRRSKDRKKAAVDPDNTSRVTVHSSRERERDITCFANVPYVTSKFRPSEKGIRRVDYITSLADELRSALGLRKCPNERAALCPHTPLEGVSVSRVRYKSGVAARLKSRLVRAAA